MITETFYCKICQKKYQAKGATDFTFHFSKMLVNLKFFIHILKKHYNQIPNKIKFFCKSIKNIIKEFFITIFLGIMLILQIVLLPLYLFLKNFIYFNKE